MTRYLILAALAVITPVRRGLSRVEGRLARAEYRLRHGTGALFVALAVGVISLAGCHGAERATRTALDVAAHAVDETDAAFAPVYRERARAILDSSTTLEEYVERRRPLDHVEDALDTAASVLRASEAALDVHGADGILPTIGCVVLALTHLVDALDAAGVETPDRLRRAVETVRTLGLAACSEEPLR